MDKERMDKARKKRIKRYITWACMAAVVLLLTAMPLLAKNEAEADGPVASVLSATAETGSISTALHGGGTLESKDAEDVTLPSGVKITEFLVKNGDYVTAGTPVALVDKVSVMTAITSVNETLEFLEDELQDARDEKIGSTISATAGGRVKKIFAQKGESVQEVMLRDGALAILSIDGLMAVKLEADSNLLTGEAVAVELSTGETVTGRIDSNLNGVVIVTIDDKGYSVGDTVKVVGIGSGTLYIHNAWTATAYSGTIATVHAQEEKVLSKGASLFTLENRSYLGQLQYRAGQHQEYTELLQELLQMHQTGTLTAPCDGVVSGVDEDSPYLLAAGEDEWNVELLNNTQSGYKIIFLSNPAPIAGCTGDANTCTEDTTNPALHVNGCQHYCTGKPDCPATSVHKNGCESICTKTIGCKALDGKHLPGCYMLCAGDAGTTPDKCSNDEHGNHKDSCIYKCSGKGTETDKCSGTKNHYLTCIESCIPTDGSKDCPATKTHKTNCLERCSQADVESGCDADTHHYTSCIKACKSSTGKNDPCPADKHKSDCYFGDVVYWVYVAKVFSPTTGTELIVHQTAQPVRVAKKSDAYKLPVGSMTEEKKISNTGGVKQNDIIVIIYGYKGDDPVSFELGVHTPASAEDPSKNPLLDSNLMMGNMDLSAMMGDFSGYGNFSGTSAQTESESLYPLQGSTILTVTPQGEATVTMTIDEHDIAKVSLGDKATVSIMALRDQDFPATVTRVGTTGTNNGGSSKFEVELTASVSQEALIGMSVTGQIPLDTRENVTILPIAALVEEGAKTVVYTALDPDTGKPVNPVEVETGLSDGENVEILSGLNPGDTVHYLHYDTMEMDHSAVASKVTFG